QSLGGTPAAPPGGGVVARDAGPPGPGLRLPPGRREGGQVTWDAFPPVGTEPGRIPRPAHLGVRVALLPPGGGERERQAANVFDEIAERVRRARGGPVQRVVLDVGHEVCEPARGWAEV